MTGKENKSVFGLYSAREKAEHAVAALHADGFSPANISVLLAENMKAAENRKPAELATEQTTKAPEAAAVGVGSGAALGGAVGWLVGAGALILPGIGPVIAAGPILAALAGMGIGGALGGFAGTLVGMGIPEDEAKIYEGQVLKGGTLVAVSCDSAELVNRAEHILRNSGAQDVVLARGSSPSHPGIAA